MGITSQLASARYIQSGTCTSSTRPTAPYQGQMIYETDTNMILLWNGSTWQLPFEQRYQRITLTNDTTTSITISGIPQYGNTLHFRGQMRSMRNYSTNTGGRWRINGLTGASDYIGNINNAGAGGYTSVFGYLGQIPDAGDTVSGEYQTFEGYIPDYSTNTQGQSRKTVTITSGSNVAGTYVISTLVGSTSGCGAVTSVFIQDDISGALRAGTYLEVWIGA